MVNVGKNAYTWILLTWVCIRHRDFARIAARILKADEKFDPIPWRCWRTYGDTSSLLADVSLVDGFFVNVIFLKASGSLI